LHERLDLALENNDINAARLARQEISSLSELIEDRKHEGQERQPISQTEMQKFMERAAELSECLVVSFNALGETFTAFAVAFQEATKEFIAETKQNENQS